MLDIDQMLEEIYIAKGWTVDEKDEDRTCITVALNGSAYRVRIFSYPEVEFLVIVADLPLNAPPEWLIPLAEFLHRANHNLIVGNFLLAYSDGRISYSIQINYRMEPCSRSHFQGKIGDAVAVADHYLPGVRSLLQGGISPLEAIALVEG